MKGKDKKIPDNFNSYEEAGKFWDNNDSIDLKNDLEEADMQADIKKHYFLLKIDGDVVQLLNRKAKQKGVSANKLANEILKEKLAKAK